jgi:hypothetical protein
VSSGYLVRAGAPDYHIISTTVNSTGTKSAAFSGTNRFEIENIEANPGAKPITWRVYRSLDTLLGNGDDVEILSGTLPGLDVPPTTGLINITGSWPAFGSYYRFIVEITADDDIDTSNNRWVSPEVEVPDVVVAEGINNDDQIYPFPSIPNLGTIALNQLVQVNGFMDLYDLVDNFRWMASAGVHHVEVKIKWTTGYDDCDIWFWTTAGLQSSSQDYENDEEPRGVRFTSPYLGPTEYYTAVYFWRAGNTRFTTTDTYTLLICGR